MGSFFLEHMRKEGLLMLKKFLALVLALVMCMGIIPMATFSAGEGNTDAATVDKWEANYEVLLDRVLDNEKSFHWNYVAQNNEAIASEMLTYTVFALYDDAWQNGFDQTVSVTKAEEVLVSLIEKVDAQVGDSKLDEIIKVLETAQDVNDFIQKVNGYVEISEILTSQTWSDVFTYLGYAQTLAEIWRVEREVLIENYARILSVQAANEYYLELLQYIAENCSYGIVVRAAENLIADIETSIDQLVKEIMLKAAGNTAAEVVDVAARIAADTNAYTAVALKVYNTGTSVADKLWNTGDQYVIMDQLYTTFFVETEAAAWAKSILDSCDSEADAEKAVFAVNSVLTLREIGAQSLFELKKAQAGGIIGKVKDRVNKSVCSEYISDMNVFAGIRAFLFGNCYGSNKVGAILVAFGPAALSACKADASVLYEVPYGYCFTGANANGVFSEEYNEYSRDYVKVAFVYDTVKAAKLVGMSEGNATFIMNVLTDDGVVDYSFTDAPVIEGTELYIPLEFSGVPTYTVTAGEETAVRGMNDQYIYPVENEVTTDAIVNAVVEVARHDTNESVNRLKNLIKSFFENFFKSLFESLFKSPIKD